MHGNLLNLQHFPSSFQPFILANHHPIIHNNHMSKTIVFYDGVCHLCHGLIQFALKYDTKKTLYFSHLQSTFAAKTLAEWNDTRINFDTVYVLNQHQAKLYDRSRAVVEVLLNMGAFGAF